MKNYRLKTNVLFFLFGLLFLIYSCQKDESSVVDQSQSVNSQNSAESNSSEGNSSEGNSSKVDICHNGKILNVSINAIPAHQRHGDAVDLDDDGFFDIENTCSDADCDDNDPNINPGAEEICDNGIDDDCDGDIDEDCTLFPEPIAYYPFNGNANDESGNTNDGSVNGATPTLDRFGNPNTAYTFDGVDDFIQIPTTTENNVGSGNFTISVWIRSISANESVIFDKRNTSSCSQESGPRIGFNQTSAENNNTLSALFRNSDGDNQLYSQPTASDGNWHNIILVRDGTTLVLYIDGQLEDVDAIPPGSDFSTTLDLFIGKTIYCNGNHFTGDIDDFTIYGQALTQEQAEFLAMQ